MDSSGIELVMVAVALVVVGGWILNIVALVRAIKTPDHAFRQIGKTRSGQLTLHIVGIFLYVVGTVAGWVWLKTTKKQLDANKNSPVAFPPPPPRPSA